MMQLISEYITMFLLLSIIHNDISYQAEILEMLITFYNSYLMLDESV